MSLQKQIKEEMVIALKNREEVRLLVLRSLLSGFTNELVTSGKKPQDELDDTGALTVIKRAVKQRKDSIEQFTKGNRLELAKNEKAELKVLEKYLPEMMSEEKILEIAIAKKEELGIEDKANLPAGKAGMGILMGAVIGQIKTAGDEADGGLVKKIVEKLFS